MKNEQRKNLSKFFSLYFNFVEIELYNSLLEISVGRCNGILYEFLKVINRILKGLTQKESQEIFGKLEVVLEQYEKNAILKRDEKNPLNLPTSKTEKVIENFIDKELIDLLEIFFVAINDFRQILPKVPLDEKARLTFGITNENAPTFTQALLEFNNALSHIAIALYSNDQEDKKNNIKKAKAHLYRGSLDCYKMLVRFAFSSNNINERISHIYQKVRLKEFIKLGGNIQDKQELIESYKEIVNECLNFA
ncbi:hypothetical protein [Helicobacter sp. UBA3407]|uniref:hypothetical protein n=1 Tax=Helicobacter TaxID=209 RepID=UPI00262B16F9|nr:hypothetical protein [Helicobacter sp. UBA3407]